MKTISATVLLTIVVCADIFAQNGALMEGMNPSRTNVSPALSPVSLPTFEVIASNVSGTLKRIAADGSLILSDGATVSSYEKSGRLRWSQNIVALLNGAIVDIAIVPAGPIYVSSANTLTALDPDSGEAIWAQSFGANSGNESGPLVVDSKGTVYFHTGSTVGAAPEKLTAVNLDGTQKWEYSGRTGRGAGGVVFSTDESTSYLLQPSRSEGGGSTIVGLSAASGEVLFEAACATPGRVYAYASSNRLYTGYDSNNLLQFSPELQSCSVIASGVIVTDIVGVLNSGLLVVDVALPPTLHSYAAIDSNGQPVWFRVDPLIGGFVANAPDNADDASAVLYAIAPETNELIAVRAATGQELWRQKFDAPVSGMLAGADGNLYLVSGTDVLRSAGVPGAKKTSDAPGTANALTADITPPSVSILSPAPDSTVSGTISVSAEASDTESGVAGVQFQLDGINLGAESTIAPYSVSLDTTKLLNGAHTLTAIARDVAGNAAASAAVTVFASNPIFDFSLTGPDVAVTQGQSQSTTITATALAGPIEPVSFYIDGLPSGTTGSFSTSSCTPNCTTTLTISPSISTPPGTYVLTAEGVSIYLFDSFNIVVIDSNLKLTVNPAGPVLTSISVAPSSATVSAGGTQQFSATAADQFGVALSPQPSFSWAVSGGGSINTAGLFTAGTTAGGPFTVSASSGAVTGTASVTVMALPVVTYVQGAGTTNDGSSSSITQAFAAANASGNLIVAAISWDSNASVTCSDSQGNSYAVATTQYDNAKKQSLAICYAANVKSGANTVTATLSGSAAYRRLLIHEYQGIAAVNPLDVVAKNVANGTTTSNGITSTAAVTTASGDLIFGAVMDDAGVTTITAGTSFTQRQSVNNKDLASEDLVQVTAGSIAATHTFGSADRYLAQMVAFKAGGSAPPNAPPTVTTPAAASPNPVTATTTNLSVLGADDGGEPNLTYTWATTGSPPAAVSFSLNGTNAAKNVVATFAKAGSYSFQVTIRDPGNLTTSSNVNVTVNATLTSISVAPSSATVSAGGTQQFSATASDQFGVALSPQPSFSWAVSGGGSINTAGLFTAGATAGGPYTVSASSGAITGSAGVTVMALPVVSYVQGAGITDDGSSSSIAQAFTAANASGNLIVAAISWDSNASVTCSDSQGNSYAVATTQYDSTKNQSLAICYAANVKSGANTLTATLSSSAAYRRLLIHEYQGIAAVNPLDVVAKNVANGTTTSNGITSTAAVTTANGDLIFGAVMDDAGVTTITAGTSFTQRQSVNNKDLASEDLVQVTAGSIAATHTFGSVDRYLAQMVAFRHR